MPERPIRLNLSHVMVFIAATAAALTFWKTYLAWKTTLIGPEAFRGLSWFKIAEEGLKLFAIVEFCWAVCLTFFFLRQEGRRGEEFSGERPGFIACMAITVGAAVKWVFMLLASCTYTYSSISERLVGEVDAWLSPLDLCPLLVVAWLTLWLAKGWNPERTWMDRLGRGLGIGMIVAGSATAWISIYDN